VAPKAGTEITRPRQEVPENSCYILYEGREQLTWTDRDWYASCSFYEYIILKGYISLLNLKQLSRYAVEYRKLSLNLRGKGCLLDRPRDRLSHRFSEGSAAEPLSSRVTQKPSFKEQRTRTPNQHSLLSTSFSYINTLETCYPRRKNSLITSDENLLHRRTFAFRLGKQMSK